MNPSIAPTKKTPGQVEDEKRIRSVLPSAREIYAVRPRQMETTTDSKGREVTALRTIRWPKGATVQDVLKRVLEDGIR